MPTVAPAPKQSLTRGIAVAALVSLTGCSPCNDGLGHTDWEARERTRAAAGLRSARQRLSDALDSAWSVARPRELTDEFHSPPEQAFSLGGVYDLGGQPRYGRSCRDPNAIPSYFRLQHVYAALTADSLIVLAGKATAIDTTNPSASQMRPVVERQAFPLREVTGAWVNVVDEPRGPLVVTTTVSLANGTPVATPWLEDARPSVFIVLRCAGTSAACSGSLPVALEDSSRGRAFAAHILASARRLQGQQ